MGNNTYLSYLSSEVERWKSIADHAANDNHTVTFMTTVKIILSFLIQLMNSFPEVFYVSHELMSKEVGQC